MVQLVTSDNHTGLVSAIKKQFPVATWQRCQTHFSKNILDKAPKKLQPWLKEQLKNMDSSTDTTEHIKNKYLSYDERVRIEMRLKDGWSAYRIAKYELQYRTPAHATWIQSA